MESGAHRFQLPSRYHVTSLLGEGGAARVFRVHDSFHARELALKIVAPKEAEWLKREFGTLRQIRHENLIEVYDSGTLSSGEAFYTMELITGTHWSPSFRALRSPEDVRRILVAVLRGVAHLHCHGELHGDLKPGNILVSADGMVKVTDIGMGPEGNKIGGTAGYAAPEIWEGKSPSVQSDLYSIGIIAYQVLTGRHPFEGMTVRDVVTGQIDGWLPSPSALGMDIPSDLERAIMRALERNPALRQSSSDAFLEMLSVDDPVGEILGGRFVGRHRLMADFESLLSRDKSKAVLVWLYGPEGSGRLSILKELGYRLADTAGVFVLLEMSKAVTPDLLYRHIVAQLPAGSTQQVISPGLGALAEHVAIASEQRPIVIACDSRALPTDGAALLLKEFGRYLASSLRPQSQVLICTAVDTPPPDVEAFEQLVEVPNLDLTETKALAEGLLGNFPPNDGALSRLFSLTGGAPGPINAALLELIQRRVLMRSEGRWKLQETEPINRLQLRSAQSPLSYLWSRVQPNQRGPLIALAMLRNGATLITLEKAFGENVLGVLHAGQMRGWVRQVAAEWRISSEVTRMFLLAEAGEKARQHTATFLLAAGTESIGLEDHVDLLLEARQIGRAVSLMTKATQLASDRGAHAVAAQRLERILREGHDRLSQDDHREFSLLLGIALRMQGKELEAIEALTSPKAWPGTVEKETFESERALTLGQAYRAIGNAEASRAWFTRAVASAKKHHDVRGWLRAHAELAQHDWELGSEGERRAATSRIRGVLSELSSVGGVDDEKATLVYGLGAALIWSGERREAKAVLMQGIELQCSSFWKMRIANALCSASMYLAEYEESLRWSNDAWARAEEIGADSFKARILANRGATLHALGDFKESAREDMLSVEWARKTGNLYEYEAGLQGAAVNSIALARYEDALAQATEAAAVAARADNERHLSKAKELEALTWFLLGDLDQAADLVEYASALLREHEYVETRPRLDWLNGRILFERGNHADAIEALSIAEAGLLLSGDLEDLLGVQVELTVFRGLTANAAVSIEALCEAAQRAKAAGILLARLNAIAGIGQILAKHGPAGSSHMSMLSEGLAKAESVGVLEVSWQLDRCLGTILLSSGNPKDAQVCMNRAFRTIREIADRLSPKHRNLYLRSKRVERGITSIASII
jgi:tetratricopeptide (TPR) repeat protein